MNTRVKLSATNKADIKDVSRARSEAIKSNKTSGKTSVGIRFRKLAEILVLF